MLAESISISILLSLAMAATVAPSPDVQTIIKRSVASNDADWKADPQYSYLEEDRSGNQDRTYEVTMLEGSPYRRLVKTGEMPLPPAARQKEERKLEAETRRRNAESQEARLRRIDLYHRDRARDRLLIDQLARAFNFTLAGRQKMGARDVFVIRATPRSGYVPPNTDARVLLGMEGELWIDAQAFQWVKVTAKVIHPVSIYGFLARVEPGTEFELEKAPVAPGIWLPTHFAMKSQSRILSMFRHQTQDDEVYSDYHRIDASQRQ